LDLEVVDLDVVGDIGGEMKADVTAQGIAMLTGDPIGAVIVGFGTDSGCGLFEVGGVCAGGGFVARGAEVASAGFSSEAGATTAGAATVVGSATGEGVDMVGEEERVPKLQIQHIHFDDDTAALPSDMERIRQEI
jgi:hypothetical protein